MKAVLVNTWRPFHELTLQELPTPTIAPNEVLIRVRAAGVSFAVSLVVQGKYQRKPPLPFVPGSEVAGEIAQVGEQVTRFKVGDRVCAVLDWGGLAEFAAAKAVNTYALPDTLDFPPAIAFTNSYATSAAALTWPHLWNVQAGQTLLVHGAAGGVGLAAIEIGKILGATVIATAGSTEKLAAAKAHGADYLINYRTQEFRDEVLAITGGVGVNAVYDPVGGEVFTQSLRCMAPEGRIMPVGFAGGDIPNIPANLLLVKNLTVCGLNLGYYYGWSPQDKREEFEPRMRATLQQLFDWFVEGRIRPHIAATYPLADFQQAMAAVLGRTAIGRVAVMMDADARV